MNNSSTRIAAGMVLYNSDYERLLKCLDSLNEQVELIIAFDNSPQILEDRKITAYQLSKATGIAESSFGQWRKTPSSNIRSGNLVLIADYLNCSVDYLLGRTEDPELHQK